MPVPSVARVPSPPVETAVLSAAERARRKKQGPRTRLTQKLMDDAFAAIKAVVPIPLVEDLVGVPRGTFARWQATSRQAETKPWASRSQFERMCLKFSEGMRRAQGEAGLRTHGAIARHAGLTSERVKVKEVTRRTNPDGSVTVTEVERELKPDWRAAAAIASYRFPDEMGSTPPPEPDAPAGTVLTVDRMMAVFAEVSQARQQITTPEQ